MTEPSIMRPAPIRKRDNAFFWNGAKNEELRIQSCNGCGELQHPPTPMCPHCQSIERAHRVMTGKGKVYSWIIPRYPQVPMFEDGLIVALINLDEGVRILSNLCEVDADKVFVGMDVELCFADAASEEKIPQFRPSSK